MSHGFSLSKSVSIQSRELRAEFIGLHLHAVYLVLARYADEPKLRIGLCGLVTTGWFVFFADNDSRERLIVFVFNHHQLAHALLAELIFGGFRLDHAIQLMVAGVVAYPCQYFQIDKSRGSQRQLIFGIGRIILMRRQRPYTIGLGDFKLAHLAGAFVEGDNPHPLCLERIVQFWKQRFTDHLVGGCRRRSRPMPMPTAARRVR